jgi:ADP-heptose:LPS heptosyltransferase
MRILIIRPGALGDTLMLAPALAQMKGRGDIALVARRPGLDILRPFVREGMDYEIGGWYRLFMDDPSLIRNGLFNNITKPSPSTRAGQGEGGTIDLAVAFLSDQSEKVRDNLEVLVPGSPIYLFPPFPQKEESMHVAFHLANSLAASGCPVSPARAIADALRRPSLWAEPFPLSDFKRRIVFHPGSGGTAKNHPREFWTALLHDFRGIVSNKAPLAVLLGPAEEPCLSFYRELLSGDKTEIIFSPEIEPLLRLLKSAPLYLGHDSGITHLAAMLGTPTIALFRTSNLDQWKPLGPRVEVIEEESSPDLIRETCEKAREMVLYM